MAGAISQDAAGKEIGVAGSTSPAVVQVDQVGNENPSWVRRTLNFLYWVPPRCRGNPKFTVWHNILYAFAGAFTVANLYYNHPILNILADEFDTSQTGVSRIPTLMQAGYAVGLLFVLPIGDLVPIRRLTLTCIFITAMFW